MKITRRLAYAAGIAAAAGGIALAGMGPASAAGTVNGPFPNIGEAGYQIHSAVPFNEVRTTITIPAGASTSSFIALQNTVNGGTTFAEGLYFDAANGNYYLMGVAGIDVNAQTGVPLPIAVIQANLVPIPTLGAPICITGPACFDGVSPLFSNQTGGSYYVELHYSTKRHLVQYIAGPTETDNAVLDIDHNIGLSFDGTLNAPAIETLNFGGINLPVTHQEASFTRSGITEPAGHNVGGIAGTRVTFDFFATDEAIATGNGGPATIGNPVTLKPSPALPGVGSAFGVITGP